MDYYLAWLIPLAPLIAACVCTLQALLKKFERVAHLPVVAGLTISSVASLWLLMRIDVAGTGTIAGGYGWLESGPLQVAISLQLDAISLVQICVVTVVSTLVACYSRGYMHGDAGYARYFAVFAAFVFSMSMLVLASNLLVLYAFWEGVGFCSYLLIGFWYERPSAARAATKAFLVNRIADCGFLLGILLLWYGVGLVADPVGTAFGRLDYQTVFETAPVLAQQHPTLLAIIAAMLLLGAIGKSAQFPLHVWLPDAMEGPTPVSALIHAATMVTAGVYLLCRMTPLLVLTPAVLILAGWVGGITALLAALIALFQHDLKRVLAYSTVSQLGYMFMAISCGVNAELMSAAVMAALFHVATHAFFKALLFLSAGNVMHAMGDVIDMREFGGLRRLLPRTNWFFAIGAAALSGFPLLSGFWSKDGILSLLAEARHDSPYSGSLMIFMVIGVVTVFLTAIYIFRAYFRTFHGLEKIPIAAGKHPHEAADAMLWPLFPLAAGSLLLGLAMGPTGLISHYMRDVAFLTPLQPESHHWLLLIVSNVVAFAAIGLAWWATRSGWTTSRLGVFGESLARDGYHRFYFDELYSRLFVQPLEWCAGRLAEFDVRWVDRAWRGTLPSVARVGGALRKLQTGSTSQYATAIVLGTILFLLVVVLR